jgi:hypothetical protein
LAAGFINHSNLHFMARRKKHYKHHSRRRRHHSVGAMKLNPKNPIVQIGAMAAGYFLADTINGPIDSMVGTKIPEKVVGIAELGIGSLLVYSNKKTALKTIAGGVLAGAGLKKSLKSFGVISGYGSVPVIGRRMVAGYGSVPVIGEIGYNPGAQQLNGYQPGAGMLGGSMPVHKSVVGGLMRGE